MHNYFLTKIKLDNVCFINVAKNVQKTKSTTKKKIFA